MPAGSIVESRAINSACWILFHESCMRNTPGHFGKKYDSENENSANDRDNY